MECDECMDKILVSPEVATRLLRHFSKRKDCSSEDSIAKYMVRLLRKKKYKYKRLGMTRRDVVCEVELLVKEVSNEDFSTRGGKVAYKRVADKVLCLFRIADFAGYEMFRLYFGSHPFRPKKSFRRFFLKVILEYLKQDSKNWMQVYVDIQPNYWNRENQEWMIGRYDILAADVSAQDYLLLSL